MGTTLPVSKRAAPDPDVLSWRYAERFLEAVVNENTRKSRRTGLRHFADWVQHKRRDDYEDQEWPLDPAFLTLPTITDYGVWLSENFARKTQLSYAAAIVGYFKILDSLGHWPSNLSSVVDVRQKLQRKRTRADDEQDDQQQPPLPWLHAESYLAMFGHSSPRTQETYLTALRVFAKWVQKRAMDGYAGRPWPLDPAFLTTNTVLNFNDWLNTDRSQNTRATYMAGVTGYLEELATNGDFPPHLSLAEIRARMRRMSRLQPRSSSRVLDFDADRLGGIPAIVKHFRDDPIPPVNVLNNKDRLLALRNRAIVYILYSTAMRVEELASLNRKDVDDGRRARPLIMGKGRKGRTIYLREEAQEAVRVYVTEREDANPALFVTHGSREGHENERIDQRVVQRVIQNTRKTLDIEADLTPHDFRHYKATSLLRAGMPLEDVQEFLGHEDVSTTRSIYAPVLGVDRIESSLRRFDTPIAEL